jgi:MSHA biogenesis protein MshJ
MKKTGNAVETLAKRFDRLSLRERVLTSAATLVVLVALFHVLLLQRLESQRKQLTEQLSDIVASVNDSAGTGDGTDSPGATLEHTIALAAQLKQTTALLDSQSAGLIPPQRMTQVIHDVLSRQQGVTLISLRSVAPHALLDGSGAGSSGGPYVHSVVLVIQGQYLDVLAYLQALEGLQWHFYWQSLELDATRYPMTQVTVRLGTVSMSPEWIQL